MERRVYFLEIMAMKTLLCDVIRVQVPAILLFCLPFFDIPRWLPSLLSLSIRTYPSPPSLQPHRAAQQGHFSAFAWAGVILSVSVLIEASTYKTVAVKSSSFYILVRPVRVLLSLHRKPIFSSYFSIALQWQRVDASMY